MKTRQSLLWVVLIFLALVGLITWIVLTRPSTDAVTAAVRPLPSLPADDLSDQAFAVLQSREQNGTLPVTTQSADPSRVDPFH